MMAATVVVLALLSRRTRRFLRWLPCSWLVLIQVASASALVTYRGLDALALLTGGSRVEAGKSFARYRGLTYALLLGSSLAVPAKGIAHLYGMRVEKRKTNA